MSSALGTQTPDDGEHRINLSWLTRLRWGAIAGQFVTIVVVYLRMGIDLQLAPLLTVVALESAANVAVARWLARDAPVRGWMPIASNVADVLALTALLYFSGGPYNPFSFLYLVHIALAAAVLRARWIWMLVGLSLLCYGGLFVDHVWLRFESLQDDHAAHMRMHLEGMWVAFVVAAGFIAHFGSRMRRALATREAELARARDLAARNERLASLATLATGAAHELSTPLGTIAVTVKDLALDWRDRIRDEPELGADLQLIRNEVDRCRRILDQMAVDAGESGGSQFDETTVRALVEAAAGTIPDRPVRLAGDEVLLDRRVEVPRRSLEQALGAVLKNAREASPADGEIAVEVAAAAGGVAIRVRDRGCGIDARSLARIGEPFYTTKEPGRGMGLGVFLARAVLTSLGGGLEYESRPSGGTTATLRLPLPVAAVPPSVEPIGGPGRAVDARGEGG